MSRPHSPFRGTGKPDLAMLRGLAVGVQEWADAAKAGRYYWPKYAPEILQNSGGIRQAEVLNDFYERAWARLRKSQNWADIVDAHNLERMRQYEPQAYQIHQLRKELARHIKECREV